MYQSLTIARLVGPVLSTIGIGMLANQATYREIAAQFLAGFPFIYFSDVLMLVAASASSTRTSSCSRSATLSPSRVM
jgi:uncharacterized membrane protein